MKLNVIENRNCSDTIAMIWRELQGCSFLTVHLPIPFGNAQKVQSVRRAEKVATELENRQPLSCPQGCDFIMNWHFGQPAEDESVLFLKQDLVGSQSEAS